MLPGTGGLTRLVDKRKIRRDLADAFSTIAEGVRGKRAVEWGLVDESPPKAKFDEAVKRAPQALAARRSARPSRRMTLTPLEAKRATTGAEYKYVSSRSIARTRTATLTVRAPTGAEPRRADELAKAGAARVGAAGVPRARRRAPRSALQPAATSAWSPCKTTGDAEAVLAVDAMLAKHKDDGLVREVTLLMKRVLKRLDMTAKSFFALAEPGSCFAGSLLELALAADRIYMKDDRRRGRSRVAHARR